jgi:uncharacterized protein with HEPN domain
MPHDVRKSVWDALNACRKLQEYTKGLTVEAYQADYMRRLATERLFTILGEAFNRINEVAPSLRVHFPEMGKFIRNRNHITHEYDFVDDKVVWLVAKQNVPALADKLAAWLAENGGESPETVEVKP